MNEQSSSNALGEVIRSRREALELSQEQLGLDAGYGKGAGVSISRIESGMTTPSEPRFAGIALSLGVPPERLRDEAAAHASKSRRENTAPGSGPAGREARAGETKAPLTTKQRVQFVQQTVADRTQVLESAIDAFNNQHDLALERFVLRFADVAAQVIDAPQPAPPDEAPATQGDDPVAEATRRLEFARSGFAEALFGAPGGIAGGAAAGGATAYATFTAATMLGTASTGAAISGSSGIAATKATLALLGGGSLAARGAGVAGGTLVIAGIVAAPAAILGIGGVVWMVRRSRKKEEELRAHLDRAEAEIKDSAPSFDKLIEILKRATHLLRYIQIHGSHALSRWEAELPPRPAVWINLSEDQHRAYHGFINVAAGQIIVASINPSEIITARGDQLHAVYAVADTLLIEAERTIKDAV